MWRRFGYVLIGAVRGFFRDDCYNKASTLTFYTLQAIVPFLAFLLGIAKGFGFDAYIETLVTRMFEQQKEILEYAIQIAHSMLQHIQGGVIVGFGVLFLIYTTLSLLQYIESAFNQIWKIRVDRTLIQKYSAYIAALVICPLIFAVSSSLTVYVKSQLINLESNPQFHTIGSYLLVLFRVLPWLLSCIIFFLLYALIPDSTNKLWTKVVGALFAGTAFQLWQMLYITLQVKVFTYNAVYGTFAIIPLFLIWLQFSWIIALAGAELSAHLEIDVFPKSKHAKKISNRELGLLIVYHVFNAFREGKKPLTDTQIARQLRVPLDVTQKMIDLLVEGEVLAAVQTKEGTGYHPMCDGQCFKLKQVIDLIDSHGDLDVYVDSTESLKIVSDRLKQLDDLMAHSKANISISSFF